MEMKLPQVMRNINEFNIPCGDVHSYEIISSGVNLIMMVDYKLSFNIEVKNSDIEIDVLIISRKDVTVWKNNDGYSEVKMYNNNQGIRIHDTFSPR